MPNVPTFTDDARVHEGPTPGASPGAFAQAGEALAQGAGRVSNQMAEFDAKYQDARRSADATNIIAGATQQLGALEFKWSKTPDRQKALEGFNGEATALRQQLLAGVSDPYVGNIIGREFDTTSAGYSLSVGNRAFELESRTRIGDLERNNEAYAEALAAAPNDLVRAKISDNAVGGIRTAVAAGWLDPAKGAELEIDFKSKTAEVQARQLYNAAQMAGDPNAANAAVRALSDPNNFPGLLPDTRERWIAKADTLAARLEARGAAALAHADAVAERNQHRAQESNEATAMGLLLSGRDVDNGTVGALLNGHQITAAGASAILSTRDRLHEGSDDAGTVVRLWHGIDTRHASPQDIYAAIGAGTVKGTTGAQMIRALDAGGPTSNAAERGAFNVLKTAMHGQAIELGSMNAPEVTTAWAQAQGDWHRRVTLGREDPTVVLNDLMKHYAHATTPTWLTVPRFGAVRSNADLQGVAQRTAAALAAGTIDQATADAQRRLLNEYFRFYPPAPAKPHGGHP